MAGEEIHVIGHINPDTDSVCSAIAYAAFKRQMTGKNYTAKRAGQINSETRFVLQKFGVPEPEYLSDVRTQVFDIDVVQVPGVGSDISLKRAWEIMKEGGLATLPVVCKNGQLEGLIKPNTKLIYVESPANPTMVLVDIAAVVEIAHKHGVKVFIDNTFATPYNTTPLDLGVDAVIHSLTKYIGGHGDLLGGAVISNDEQFLRECRLGTLMHFGSVMAPFTAFLVCRGLKTLGVRMKQYNESALKIAKWLEANPKIETVRYPFLESNPQYAIAKKQMKGGGGMISFDVAGGLEAGKKFINSLKLCTLAVSLGDTETLVEQAAAMTHTMIPKEIREAAGITDGMIRMSVGLEDPDDIIADLKQALGD